MIRKTATVVVTYNRKKLLQENIEALLKQTVRDTLEIIIIDNASTDGTFEAIKNYIDNNEIVYINTGSNLGGAGGFQYGIRYAAEHDYEFVWVMDDDCIPNENTLEKFYEADKKLEGNYGFLSSKVLWKDLNICNMNIQRRTLTKNINNFRQELIPVVMASFVSLFIKTTIVKKVGLPIKEFFIWTDDWEYTRRISREYPCYVVSNSTVIHKSVSNIGANIYNDSPERLERYNYLYRNDVYLYRREGIKGFVYEFFRLSSHILRVIFQAKNNKFKRIQYILKGTNEGLKFNPQIEYIQSDK